jgi:hypothetical protein
VSPDLARLLELPVDFRSHTQRVTLIFYDSFSQKDSMCFILQGKAARPDLLLSCRAAGCLPFIAI